MRVCYDCGARDSIQRIVMPEHTLKQLYKGELITFTARNVPVKRCKMCESTLFTGESEEVIQAAFKNHLLSRE